MGEYVPPCASHVQHFSWPNLNPEAKIYATLDKFRACPIEWMLTQVTNNACAKTYTTHYVVIAILLLSLRGRLRCHSSILLPLAVLLFQAVLSRVLQSSLLHIHTRTPNGAMNFLSPHSSHIVLPFLIS